MINAPKSFRLRSFVRRDSRATAAQNKAYLTLWPQFGLDLQAGIINYAQVFVSDAPTVLEIGFGSGQSLLAAAQAYPNKNFIGIETHKPGIGALLLGIQAKELTNIRIYHADAIDVLNNCMPDAALDNVQIFFPDPWPKRKHHPRRLIQTEFLQLVLSKLKIGGQLHLATDWEDYARHMLKVVSAEEKLINLAGVNCYGERSIYRPIISKFEKRAQQEGRAIWELQLEKIA